MLLPLDPDDLIKEFLTVDPQKNAPGIASILVGAKESSPTLYRKFSEAFQGKRSLSFSDQDELFAQVFSERGVPQAEWERVKNNVDAKFSALLETNATTPWRAHMRRLCFGFGLPRSFEDAAVALEAASHRLWEYGKTANIDGIRQELIALSYLGSPLTTDIAKAMRGANSPDIITHSCPPLILVGVLHLIAMFESYRPLNSELIPFTELMPRAAKDGRIERPMRRWMQCVQHVAGHATMTQTQRALSLPPEENTEMSSPEWKGDTRRTDMRRYLAYERTASKVPSQPHFNAMLETLKLNEPQIADQKINSLKRASYCLPFFENMLITSEKIQGLVRGDYSPEKPFVHYPQMLEAAKAAAQ